MYYTIYLAYINGWCYNMKIFILYIWAWRKKLHELFSLWWTLKCSFFHDFLYICMRFFFYLHYFVYSFGGSFWRNGIPLKPTIVYMVCGQRSRIECRVKVYFFAVVPIENWCICCGLVKWTVVKFIEFNWQCCNLWFFKYSIQTEYMCILIMSKYLRCIGSQIMNHMKFQLKLHSATKHKIENTNAYCHYYILITIYAFHVLLITMLITNWNNELRIDFN